MERRRGRRSRSRDDERAREEKKDFEKNYRRDDRRDIRREDKGRRDERHFRGESYGKDRRSSYDRRNYRDDYRVGTNDRDDRRRGYEDKRRTPIRRGEDDRRRWPYNTDRNRLSDDRWAGKYRDDPSRRDWYDRDYNDRFRRSPSPHAGRGRPVHEYRVRKSVSSSSSSSSSEEEDLTEDQLMAKFMGVQSFDTSKGKDHSNADLSGANKKTKRKYRQYMNRRGGFNRPLSPVF